MAGLGATIVQLTKFKRMRDIIPGASPSSNLTETTGFGSNPGALRMWTYAPATLPPRAPLVVVLHGCTQDAAEYDRGAGWSALAERHGFVLMFPEQTRSNNPNLCFNWFEPVEVSREGGEAQSIRQMIARTTADHGIDPARVFITGLSAGGAMTASMLAIYPEVFAAGAVIAGLPHGAAGSVGEAFEAMFQGHPRSADEWGNLARAASGNTGRWPTVQIWHGTADATVKPINATELVKQWTNLHSLPPAPTITDTVDGAQHEVWRGKDGAAVLELYLVPGMAHGTPLDTANTDLDHAAGRPQSHMLEAGIGSSWHIAKAWGLLTAEPEVRTEPAAASEPAGFKLPSLPGITLPALPQIGAGPAAVIDKALRAAGLLR